MKPKKQTIKVRKGVITCSLLAALWLPLLIGAANVDKHANNPAWMDWGFFGNTIISASLTRWSSKRDDE